MTSTAARAIDWSEQGLVPDTVIRHGIRRLLKRRLSALHADAPAALLATKQDFIQAMKRSPIAPLPARANDQHYEVPAAFFDQVLGRHNKYSCAYWNTHCDRLDVAEADALSQTCEHAGIRDGMDILELGCGWGSLTLWMASRYPNSRIVAMSNSASQKAHIDTQLKLQNLHNVEVITGDINSFRPGGRFDRVVSVEMFEHLRNYQVMFAHVADWLKPGGKFFMHIFCHRDAVYAFEDQNASDWMSRYFFTGGMMPSDDLPLYFQEHLRLEDRWRWDGTHYARTADAWLENMDANRERIMPVLHKTYGEDSYRHWWMRWRMFFMACSELFAYDNGTQWWVSHYLFTRRGA